MAQQEQEKKLCLLTISRGSGILELAIVVKYQQGEGGYCYAFLRDDETNTWDITFHSYSIDKKYKSMEDLEEELAQKHQYGDLYKNISVEEAVWEMISFLCPKEKSINDIEFIVSFEGDIKTINKFLFTTKMEEEKKQSKKKCFLNIQEINNAIGFSIIIKYSQGVGGYSFGYLRDDGIEKGWELFYHYKTIEKQYQSLKELEDYIVDSDNTDGELIPENKSNYEEMFFGLLHFLYMNKAITHNLVNNENCDIDISFNGDTFMKKVNKYLFS